MEKSYRSYDIYIVGLGILGMLQITKETEQVLGMCNEIFYLHTEPRIAQGYFERVCPRVTNLQNFYEVGINRTQAYKKMTEAVLRTAVERSPVALAVYGNPTVFVSPTQAIVELASKFNLSIKVLPAVSALDCMLVDLKIDPAEGTIIYEVNDLLLLRRKLLPDMHCFIWQVGGVESGLYTTKASQPNRFLRLKKYLLESYPPEHKATVITSATLPGIKPELTDVEIQHLESVSNNMSQAATLYIPPSKVNQDVDMEFYNLLMSEEHLARITSSE